MAMQMRCPDSVLLGHHYRESENPRGTFGRRKGGCDGVASVR